MSYYEARLTESRPHRHRKQSTLRRDIMRTVATGMFAISAFIGIKYGHDAIWGDHSDPKIVASEQSQSPTDMSQVQAAGENTIKSTLDGTRDFVFATAGATCALMIGIGALARQSHNASRKEANFFFLPEDAAEELPLTAYYDYEPEDVHTMDQPSYVQTVEAAPLRAHTQTAVTTDIVAPLTHEAPLAALNRHIPAATMTVAQAPASLTYQSPAVQQSAVSTPPVPAANAGPQSFNAFRW